MLIRQKGHACRQAGFSLIELLITIGLAAVLLPALLTGFVAARGGRAQQDQRIQATFLVEEAQEAVREIKDAGWSSLTGITCDNLNPCYPAITGTSWSLQNGPDPAIGDFSRVILVDNVARDAGGNIVPIGTDDPSTKKVTITVSWGDPIPSDVTETEYLTRTANQGYIETAENQFLQGSFGPTIKVTNTLGGEVILGPGGSKDWCDPATNIVEQELPRQGIALAVSAQENRVFVGTGQNSSGESLAVVNTEDPNNPVLQPDTIDGYKTNRVFVDGGFGYVATDDNQEEVVIVDVSGASPQKIGSFNAPNNQNNDGISVYAYDNKGYVTVGDKLFNFDLSSKTGQRPALDADGVNLSGDGNKVMVVGNYAYVASNTTSNQLEIIDIKTNPTNMIVVGSATVSGGEGKDVFISADGTRAYLVTATTSNPELFIIDITTKTGNSHPIVGTYDSNHDGIVGDMNPNGVTVIEEDERAIIVGQGAEEYQVIKLEDETTPIYCGGLNFNFDINGVSSVRQGGIAYSFIVTPDADKELKIITGGSGGGGGLYASQGTFISQTFDASEDVVFNSFSATKTVTTDPPSPTNIDFSVALKPPGVNGCIDADFSSGFYSYDAVPFGTSGQCFKYKATLSSDGDFSQTPTLFDITFNYSL